MAKLKKRQNCLLCGKKLKRTAKKYCNNHCQNEYQHQRYIARWLLGFETGRKGRFYAVSDHVRRWMRETYGNKCSKCGWAEKHPISGKVPVTIHHIDGDVANNNPENLELLCPNCHSLTSTFGSLNRGNGKRPHHKGGYLTPD